MKSIVVLLLFISLMGSWALAQERQGDRKRGEAIYQQHCLRCHGSNGNGEGPEAAYLTVPPANFLSDRSRLKSDLELLTIIAHGSIFSPMLDGEVSSAKARCGMC